MAIDTTRPLKLESPAEGGTQTDDVPTEMNPAEDYAAVKGIAFESNTGRLFDLSAGGEIQWKDSVQTTYKTLNSITPGASGWASLGSTSLLLPATATSIVNIAARSLLRITVYISGYGGGDIGALRFGAVSGSVDSGNNYATAHGEWNAGQNGNQSTLLENTNTSLLRLAASNVTGGRIVTVIIANPLVRRKICDIVTATEFGGAGTTPRRTTNSSGIWANAVAQIVAVQLRTAGGNTLLAGSGFLVEGIDL